MILIQSAPSLPYFFQFHFNIIFPSAHRCCRFSKYKISYSFNIPTHAHNIYTLKSTKIHIKTLKNLPLHVSVHFKDHLQGARGQYFVKLLSWDLLIYVRYRIVRFAAICHYSPSVCVCLVSLTEWNLVMESLSKEHQTHIQTDCNDIRPQTAQFYNERISTDLNLVTWQSTVHEPPEDGLKNGPKHVGTNF